LEKGHYRLKTTRESLYDWILNDTIFEIQIVESLKRKELIIHRKQYTQKVISRTSKWRLKIIRRYTELTMQQRSSGKA